MIVSLRDTGPMPPSRLIHASAVPPALCAGTPVLRAYGEQDEPERLVVLIADAFSQYDRDGLVEICLSKRSGWKERTAAFTDLLLAPRGHGLVVIDPDAWFSPSIRRDEPDRRLNDVLAPLEIAIARGGWTLVRTTRERGLPDGLRQLPTENVGEMRTLDALAPSSQTIAKALLERRFLHPDDIESICEQVAEPDLHVIRLAYDSLSFEERAVARRLSTWRGSSHVNGSCGSFLWGSLDDLSSVPRGPVQALWQIGLLQADRRDRPDDLVMPRRVRAYVARQAQFLAEEEVRQVHRRCAESLATIAITPELKIERYVHAVSSGDIELSLQTAEYSAAPLKVLARDLSEAKRWAEAVRIFEVVIEDFDADDAYAWEYLGYNLARWDDTDGRSGRNAARIRQAYTRAHELAPYMTLYHGRWLGYRAELGEDVEREAVASFARVSVEYGGDADKLSYLIRPVVAGLRRSGQEEAATRIEETWSVRLGRHLHQSKSAR